MTALDLRAIPGEDRSHCVVAFTGIQGELMLQSHEFFRVTESLRYSRILVRDPLTSWYQLLDGGLLGGAYWPIAEALSTLAPSTWTLTGASAGGFAALMLSRLLEAQKVHVFGAQATIRREWMAQHDHRFDDHLPPVWNARLDPQCLDTAGLVLDTERCEYHLHLCGERGPDATHARYFADHHPGAMIYHHPCAGHGVARYLRDEGKLAGLLGPRRAQ